MKILKYHAHNVLGIKDVEFDMEGHHLFLVGGKNGQGKTSALTALVMALAGKSGMKNYPEIALRTGEKKGKVEVELSGDPGMADVSGFKAELTWKRRASGKIDENFRLLDSTGAEAPEPRTLLKRLFQLKAFDPLEFERMKPKEQATCVADMLGLDLDKYDQERERVYAERTVLGREGKNLAARLDSAVRHEDVPEQAVDVKQLMLAMESAEAECKAKRGLEADLADLKQIQEDGTGELATLQEKIKEIKKELKERSKSIDAKEKELESTPDCDEQLKDIKTLLANASEVNEKVRDNVAYDELAGMVKASRDEYRRMTDRIADIDDERAEAVASANWPIEGMSLGPDGVIWDGLPFEQASTSQRILASVAVGMQLNPALRLLVCEHGSDLDADTLKALDKVLVENDFQMVIELVTRSKEDEGRCAVVIENGEVADEQ